MESFVIENGKLTHYQGNDVNVVIPDNVESIGEHAFEGYKNLKSVRIPDGVTEIGECAFKGCSSIEEVGFPKKLEIIGEYAFKGCKKLEEIDFPEGLRRIRSCAFENCQKLKTVRLPDSVRELDYGAFKNCYDLAEVVLSKNIYWIGPNAFRGCKSLKRIAFPKCSFAIDDGAFKGCISLESIDIPHWVSNVYKNAFTGCVNLKNVLIRSIGTSITSNSFDSTAQIKVEDFCALRGVREIDPACLQCNIDIQATDYDRGCLLCYQKMKGWFPWIVSTTEDPEEVLIACGELIRKEKKPEAACVKRIVAYMLAQREKLSSESIERVLSLLERKGGKPDRSGFSFVNEDLNRSCTQPVATAQSLIIDVPRNTYSDKMCEPNECLLVSKDKTALETIAGEFPDADSLIMVYSDNPECNIMTMRLEQGALLEITLRRLADALVGEGIIVARMHDDEHDLREFGFFDGSSIWLGDEDDLYKLNSGQLNSTAVDANEWQVISYGEESEDEWGRQEAVWDSVKKKIIKFTLHDLVCFCLNAK